MNPNENNKDINNNSQDLNNQSENMYSYHEETPKNPQNESNAIRRSLGEGTNPNLNNVPINAPTRYIDQFQKTNQITNMIDEGKNRNFQEFPNYIDNKSSEQRIPISQNKNTVPFTKYSPSQQQNQIPVYLPKPRESKKFYLIIFIIMSFFHILMIVLIACLYKFNDYDEDYLYPFFKDVHLMIFIGFGMLYALLKNHQWSSVAIILFFETISIEFSFFCYYLWYNTLGIGKWKNIEINFNVLTCIDFNSATVLISLGALIGKLSLIQYFWLSILETFFASLNYFLCYQKIEALDNGGSVYLFTFGSIFGIIISIILFCRENEYSKITSNPHLNSDYHSNIFSFLGSLFLWLYFPSFNIANIHSFQRSNATEILRYRGIINTYLSMIGSVISTFIVSPLIYNGKIKIEHLLNASYVGGIIIGGCCTICSYGWAAILIGSIGGGITTVCLWKLKKLLKNCKLEDTLGILHIFGIPGILGGFLTAIFIGTFKIKSIWGDNALSNIFGKDDVTPSSQAGLQIAAIFVTMAMAGISGIVSGFIVNSMVCEKNEIYFVDSELFIEDENIPLPEWKYPRHFDINLSSSGNKLDEQEREVNIEQYA